MSRNSKSLIWVLTVASIASGTFSCGKAKDTPVSSSVPAVRVNGGGAATRILGEASAACPNQIPLEAPRLTHLIDPVKWVDGQDGEYRLRHMNLYMLDTSSKASFYATTQMTPATTKKGEKGFKVEQFVHCLHLPDGVQMTGTYHAPDRFNRKDGKFTRERHNTFVLSGQEILEQSSHLDTVDGNFKNPEDKDPGVWEPYTYEDGDFTISPTLKVSQRIYLKNNNSEVEIRQLQTSTDVGNAYSLSVLLVYEKIGPRGPEPVSH